MSNLEPVLGGDDTVRRNFSKIEDLYTALEAARTRLAVVEALLNGKRVIAGNVSSVGVVVSGTGFSSAKNATGDYTVTFTAAFSAAPGVNPSLNGAGGFGIKNGAVPGTGSVNVLTYNAAGTATDSAFSFIAVGPA